MSIADEGDLKWYCVQSKPGKENYAKFQLEQQGFVCYLPLLKSKKKRRNKLDWVIQPMFPRYMFVQNDNPELEPKIRSTYGVSNMVSFGIGPALVDNEIIKSIKSHCDEEDVLTLEEDSMEQGQEVEILDGPYRGLSAIFHRKTSDSERVILLMEMMQNLVEVEIQKDIVLKKV